MSTHAPRTRRAPRLVAAQGEHLARIFDVPLPGLLQQRQPWQEQPAAAIGRRSAAGAPPGALRLKSGRPRCATIAVILTAWFSCPLAANAQQRLPTDVELKAAYCIGVASYLHKEIKRGYQDGLELEQRRIAELAPFGTTERLIQDVQAGDPSYWERSRTEDKRRVDDTYSRLQRLNSYLQPRLKHLDSEPVNAAIQQANRDLVRKMADNNACSASCPTSDDPARLDGLFACLDKCERERGTPQPFKNCKSTEWLPF